MLTVKKALDLQLLALAFYWTKPPKEMNKKRHSRRVTSFMNIFWISELTFFSSPVKKKYARIQSLTIWSQNLMVWPELKDAWNNRWKRREAKLRVAKNLNSFIFFISQKYIKINSFFWILWGLKISEKRHKKAASETDFRWRPSGSKKRRPKERS